MHRGTDSLSMETVNKILFAIPSLNSARIYAFVLRLANEFSYEARTNKAQPSMKWLVSKLCYVENFYVEFLYFFLNESCEGDIYIYFSYLFISCLLFEDIDDNIEAHFYLFEREELMLVLNILS